MRRLCWILMLFIKITTSLPTSTHPSAGPIDIHNIEHIRILNNTEETTNPDSSQNLESKQILDEDDTGFDYPIATKKEAEYKSANNDNIDLNQLRLKCLHLEKLLNLNKSPSKPSNYEQYHEEYRPVYVTTTRTTSKPTYPLTSRPSSFYITVPPANTRVSIPAASAIRYIRLEPVILQKTILSNGRTVYYWHKNLPTAIEYPSNSKYESVAKEEPYQGSYNYGYNPFYNYYYNPNFYVPPASGSYYYPNNQNVPVKAAETTTEQTTTTTTEESYSYGLSNFIPFYGSNSNTESTTTTTPEPTTTLPIKYDKPDDLPFGQQYKFVMPVPFDEGLTRQGWGYNPYIYNQQPGIHHASNNFRTPFSPQFQYLRAVVVPKVDDPVEDKEEQVTK